MSSVVEITEDHVIGEDEIAIIANTDGGDIVVTLPALPTRQTGVVVKNIGSNVVRVQTSSDIDIDGYEVLELDEQGQVAQLMTDGTQWFSAHTGTKFLGPSPNPLARAKARKIRQIDNKTKRLIGRGFLFQGQRFSLSLPAQSKMISVYSIRDSPQLKYPIVWCNADDSDTISIPDAAGIAAFYFSGVTARLRRLDSGSALKIQVRAATTIAEVRAIEDDR